jgi:hypothetical protein
VTLVPYVEVNGVRTLTDEYLVDVFERLEDEGNDKVIFHDHPISTGREFVAMMKRPANVPVFALNARGECCAFAWLNNIGKSHAYGHFGYLRSAEGPDPIDIGKSIVKYWFEVGHTLDVIVGSIPEWNDRALNFIVKVGLTRLGPIPNMYVNPFTSEKCSAVIHYIAR